MDTRDMLIVSMYSQFRYKVKFDTMNIFGDFQNQFADRYPFSSLENNSKASLRDEKEPELSNRNIYLALNNFGLMHDMIKEKDMFINETNELFNYITKKLPIDNINRAGIRVKYILPVDQLEESFELLAKKLFGKNAIKQMGVTLGDLKVEFITKTEDSYTHRFSLGFATRLNEDEQMPKAGLMVDVDTFIEDVNLKDCQAFINSSTQRCTKITENFLNSLLVRSDK